MLEYMTPNYRLELDEIQRRLFTMIQIGKVHSVNHAKARLRVAIGPETKDSNEKGVITAELPWLTYRAGSDSNWWAPEVNEQVLVLSIAGELTNGVVLPAIYQNDYPAPETNKDVHCVKYADGTSIKYDRAAHTLTIDVNGGDVTLNTTANITASAGGDAKVSASGDVNVDGANINLNGGASGGVVCQSHVCAFTGSPHPQGSATVKGGD